MPLRDLASFVPKTISQFIQINTRERAPLPQRSKQNLGHLETYEGFGSFYLTSLPLGLSIMSGGQPDSRAGWPETILAKSPSEATEELRDLLTYLSKLREEGAIDEVEEIVQAVGTAAGKDRKCFTSAIGAC